MKRVIETSVGGVVLDFYGDSVVSVALLDDHGWEKHEGEWGDKEVAKALFYIAGVPENEAAAFAGQILAEYKERGGEPTGEWEDGRTGDFIASSIFFGFFGTFAVGLVTIARFLWDLGR
jgi:hypothetical protein